MRHRVITFLTDYGVEDDFAGTCRGVMKRIVPEVDVIDITHGVARQDVVHGAAVLADTLPYMPAGVHLAVVDPGVGSARRAVALAGGARVYVGPDNGLLLPAAARLGGVERAVALENDAFFLSPISATFHGRDVFAPVAAHVARGVDLEELGPPVPVDDLARVELTDAALGDDEISARVLAVDRFGNVQLDVRAVGLGTAVAVEGRTIGVGEAFADVPPGGLLAYADSYGRLALAVNRGDAAAELGLVRGATVRVARV